MAKLHTWPPKRDDDWPYCYTPDTTDEMAIALTAMKLHPEDPLNAPFDEVEIKRTAGGVLCRRKKKTEEAADEESDQLDTSDVSSDDTGGSLCVADRAGTGEVTG